MTSLPDRFHIGDLLVDLSQLRVKRGDIRVPLPNLSFDVLVALARAAPKVVSIDDLMSQVWPGLVVNPETVAQRIKLLRDALGDDPRSPQYIESLRGRGYRLLPDVKPAEAHPAPFAGPAPAHPSAASPPSPSSPVRSEEMPRQAAAAKFSSNRALIGVGLAGLILVLGAALWHSTIGRIGQAQREAATQTIVTGLPSRTVAVMPFDDLSIKHDNGQLALALPEMVLQRLGSVKDLIVIARSSSFAFIGQQVDAREIGRRLEVRYLVEGALQRMDDRLRVTTQLIDAQTGKQIRSLSFDRNLADVFALQDDIAGQLAAALQVQLMGADMNRVDRSRSTSLDAYLDYLEAQALLNRWIVKDVELGAKRLEHAIQLDPKFALAYAELARARWLARFLLSQRTPTSAEFLPLVDKALQLDPMLGEAYAMRAQLEVETDPAAAEADFRKGIELAPNYGPAYEMYGEALGGTWGRPQEALAMIERATLIDPIAPRNLYIRGMFLLEQDKDEEAETWFLRALAVAPDFPPASVRLAAIRVGNGKTAQAIKLVERALRVETQAQWIKDRACAMYMDIGDREAVASLAAGAPANSGCAVLLAVYDRDYTAVKTHAEDTRGMSLVTTYAYWVSVSRTAIQNGAIDATINWLRKELSPQGETDVPVLPEDADLGLPITLAYLYKLRNDRQSSARILKSLQGWANRHEGPPGPIDAVVKLLSGDREPTLAYMTPAVHQHHRLIWWVTERDPLLDEVRADPRFKPLLEIERARAAEERRAVDRMREAGEVPRRGIVNGSPRT